MDQDEAFDYDKGITELYNKKKYIEIIKKEVTEIHTRKLSNNKRL